MFHNVTLKQKLLAGFGAVILAMLGGTIYSFFLMRGLTSVVSKAAGIDELGRIAADSSAMVGLQRAIVLHSVFDDKESVNRFKSRYDTLAKQFPGLLDDLDRSVTSAQDKAVVANLKSKNQQFVAKNAEIMKVLAGQQVDVAEKMIADPAYIGIAEEIGHLAEQMSNSQASALQADAKSASAKSTFGGAAVLLLSLGIGGFVFQSIRTLSNQLQRLTESLATSSTEVATLCSEVNISSDALARGSSSQAASLQQTSASSEEIASMTSKNSENSQTAAKLMAAVNAQVKEGNRTLEEMLVSMKEINSSSGKISKIISVIDSIAFQTNILALNAAVEAARAGEAGMGFAVVADEVRNLAQRSAQAARDTNGLIDDSIAKTNEGSAKLELVAKVMSGITESTARVKALVDSVSEASQEQTTGINQISEAVSKMQQVTQNTAKEAEDSASSGRKLTAQAESLNDVVLELRTVVGSAAA
jgi:methyl-accepting chemotaxis protein